MVDFRLYSEKIQNFRILEKLYAHVIRHKKYLYSEISSQVGIAWAEIITP